MYAKLLIFIDYPTGLILYLKSQKEIKMVNKNKN